MNNLIKLIVILFLLGVAGSQQPAQAASKESLVKKGNAFFSSGQYDEAIKAYDEAAVDDPESPYIYYNKGTALYKKEDFTAAIDAFGKAAVKSKDVLLESKSRFNLGLCFFREGERQKDSDLKKALESYGLSVQSFQEAIELNPKFEEAAENIEMVRLMMKSLLDEIKKQEEEAKKQQEQAQKIAEQIQKLIEQQDVLLQESRTLLTDQQSENESSESTDQLSEKNQNIADAQDLLKQETQNLSQQLSSQQPPATAPTSPSGPASTPQQKEHPSKQHLDDAAVAQADAVQEFSENDTQTGVYQQEKSLEKLNKALEALKSDQNQQGGEQQQQQQQGEQQQSAQQDQGQKDQDQENKAEGAQSADKDQQNENKDEEKQPAQAMQLTDDADSILNEEKENNKQRMPFSSGGYKEVDKDW
jgi:Ca-activated chloride channel family protein